MTQARERALARGAAVASALTMGTLGLFVRHRSVAPALVAFARLSVGLVSLGALIAARGRLPALRIRPSVPLVASGAALGLSVWLYIEAIARLPLARAALLLYTGPLIAVALARIILGERVGAVRAALVLAAFVGAVGVLGVDVVEGPSDLWGGLFGAGSGLAYAALIVANRAITASTPPLGRTFHQLLVATLILAPLVPWSSITLAADDVPWLVAIGFFQGFVALTLMIYAMHRLPAHEYGLLAYLEPVTAALVGARVFGEPLTLLQVAGGGIILASGLALLRHRPS